MVKKTSGGCWDLSDQINSDSVTNAFSKLVSGGKSGYKTIIEKKVEVKKCPECNAVLEGSEKFCPNCGKKTPWQVAAEKPVVLLGLEELEKKFKSGEESESEVLVYMRDMLKMPQTKAFELVNKWRGEMQQQEDYSKIDLNQFKG